MSKSLCNPSRLSLIISILFFLLFFAVLGGIMDGIWGSKQLLPMDQQVSSWILINQSPNSRIFFLTITILGESTILLVTTLLIATGLWLSRRRLESILFVGGFGITGVSVYLLKSFTDRVGPEERVLLHQGLGAFPSGHAALSLFFFGFIAYFLSRSVNKWSHGLLVFLGGVSVAGIIGVSRIYLNLHWVSDVLGGFALAAAFLSLCIGFMEVKNQHTRRSRSL